MTPTDYISRDEVMKIEKQCWAFDKVTLPILQELLNELDSLTT
jgi:hypothetical protein